MKIVVHKLTPEQWSGISEQAHRVCFNEVKPKEWDRIDFALVAVDEERKQMIGYTTMREIDHETIYWQYGGSFPEYRGTLLAARAVLRGPGGQNRRRLPETLAPVVDMMLT